MKRHGRKQSAVTTDARPVRAPTRMPAMLSTKAVPDDVPARPAPSVAHASTIRPRRRFSGRPSGSVSPAALATPMNVDSESKRSVNRIATMAGSSDQLQRADDVELQEHRGEVGRAGELLPAAWRSRAARRAPSRAKIAARKANGLLPAQQDHGDDDPEQQEYGAMIERARAGRWSPDRPRSARRCGSR